MANARGNVLLVGSIGLEDAETVFKTLAGTVGARAKRYPDGETGARGYWIRWQEAFIKDHPQFDMQETHVQLPGFKDKVKRAFFSLREGVSADDVAFESIGYADAAIASYGVFKQLKDDGTIPAGVRFQVSLPTPTAFLSGFVVKASRAAAEAAYERAMKREVDRIAEAVPLDELAIQWDVCYEVVGQDGGYDLHYDDIIENSLARIARLAGYVPEPAELGIHLCYGDPGHKHIIEPESLATSVAFANGICARSPRSVNWVHMPVPRGRDDDAYFRPLADLALRPETELYLGLVHHTDGAEGTRRRLAAGGRYASGFGIATECGFGRRDPATIPDLLKIHDEVAGGGA
jgi:methionine synthase II (cobalamin-independent)